MSQDRGCPRTREKRDEVEDLKRVDGLTRVDHPPPARVILRRADAKTRAFLLAGRPRSSRRSPWEEDDRQRCPRIGWRKALERRKPQESIELAAR
jgi:hypothetical protein